MIELLTQIVILLTAVVGLVKLTGMKRHEKHDDAEKSVKMELPSWLQGLGDLVEFASIYAFILIPLGMMYAFMWITNEMSSIGEGDTAEKQPVAVVETINITDYHQLLKAESEQAYFNIILAKEATTTSIKHELLDKAYQYALKLKAYENALYAATEYSRTNERNEKLEELVEKFNEMRNHEMSFRAAKEVSTSSIKNDLLREIFVSFNQDSRAPNQSFQPTAEAAAE